MHNHMRVTYRDPELEHFRELLGTRLTCGKSVVDLTRYNGIAMWWFVDVEFYSRLSSRDFVTSYRPASNIFKEIEGLLYALESILLRIVCGLCRTESVNRKGKRPRIVFTAQEVQWRALRDEHTNRMRKTDVFYDTILEKLRSQYSLVGIDPMPRPVRLRAHVRSWQVLLDKLRNWDTPHKPFELFWSPCASIAERRSRDHFRRAWKILSSDPKFQQIFPSEKMRATLEHYFRFTFSHAVRYVQMARQMVRDEKPDLIMMHNEYGFFERALVVASRELEVPTLALQHGIIGPNHAGYMHALPGTRPDANCPIPNSTAVFGPYYRDLLTKASTYPEHSVVVTGQPRYDRIYHARNLYSRADFSARYGIPSEHRIVLWTTQCWGLSMDENTRNLRVVLDTTQRIRNSTLVIKQHPLEGKEHTEMINRYLSRYRTRAILTSKYADTLELLFVCDLMITKSSTTAIEAVAFHKPVIILDLGSEAGSDLLDCVEEEVALCVQREQELGSAVEALLKDDSQLARNRESFVEKFLYKIDGRATERTTNLIQRMTGHG